MKGLKIVLWVTAIGCLTSVPFIFLPWAVVESIGSWFGVELLPGVPIAVYFFKIVLGVFGLIGVFFIILAKDPLKYGSMLNLGTFGLILFGLLALILGFSIGPPLIVYLGDGLSGLVFGFAILIFSFKASTGSEEKK
jgi:FtsH-binding integral membrane protein